VPRVGRLQGVGVSDESHDSSHTRMTVAEAARALGTSESAFLRFWPPDRIGLL
jgi:hypothetical protein